MSERVETPSPARLIDIGDAGGLCIGDVCIVPGEETDVATDE